MYVPEVVAQRLVPHRGDIGAAAFFSIGVGALVQLGMLGSQWGPGGEKHLFAAAFSQLGYLSSLVSRKDLPPAQPHRLLLLLCVWAGLIASTTAAVQVLLEVASLWIVKLRLNPGAPAQISASDAVDSADAQFIGKRTQRSPAKGKPNAAASKGKKGSAPKGGRKSGKR